jgi:serine/threonine protein kinase
VGTPASIELGPYQLLERIGEGGSGQVYRARGPAGLVAIKLLGPTSDMDDAARARFRREIAALEGLAHPHLVAMLDHGVDAELGPYLVLPLLAGVNLRELVGGRALCPEAALLLLLPIVEATAALHDRGYVHRDLKPENVIAGPDGSITVIDLGLAWREGMTRHTDTGAAVGSVGYMAPEQIEGRTVDTRADIWALGVMLYEQIAGKRPFARARAAEEAAAMLLGQFPRLTAADRRCDEELADLVARCLASDPEQRPAAIELAAAVRAMIDWTDVPATAAAERAAVFADAAAYQARVAPFRVRRLERLAREALAAGKSFAALAYCDRGLAYAPDHAALLALVADAEAATARPRPTAPVIERSPSQASTAAITTETSGPAKPSADASATTSAGATARMRPSARTSTAPSATTSTDASARATPNTEPSPSASTNTDSSPSPTTSAATSRTTTTSPSANAAPSAITGTSSTATAAASATQPGRARRKLWAWLVAAGVLVWLGAIAAYVLVPDRTREPTTVKTFDVQSSTIDPQDRALVGGFIDLFGRALDHADGTTKPPPSGTPTTARGWLELAARQPPAEAVTSIRQALALSPTWLDAQMALCATLAVAKDPGAVAACEVALRRKPDDVAMLAARGAALLHAGDAQRALADLDRVVAADPDPKWRRLRARARSATGDTAGARKDLDHACELGDAVACSEQP